MKRLCSGRFIDKVRMSRKVALLRRHVSGDWKRMVAVARARARVGSKSEASKIQSISHRTANPNRYSPMSGFPTTTGPSYGGSPKTPTSKRLDWASSFGGLRRQIPCRYGAITLLGGSTNRGSQNRPKDTTILVRWTPKMRPLIFGLPRTSIFMVDMDVRILCHRSVCVQTCNIHMCIHICTRMYGQILMVLCADLKPGIQGEGDPSPRGGSCRHLTSSA